MGPLGQRYNASEVPNPGGANVPAPLSVLPPAGLVVRVRERGLPDDGLSVLRGAVGALRRERLLGPAEVGSPSL